MSININRSMRLPVEQYFPSSTAKNGIAVHHTVGGSARSTFEHWKNSADKVGTAYIIERDGTIYEVFEPEAWAWQFGLKWQDELRIAFEKRFIGIEIASEGALKEANGKLYCFDVISPRTEKNRNEAFDYGQDYRGYRYFDKYDPAQLDSLIALIDDLCTRFTIERKVPANPFDYHGEALKDFKGIIGHTMVRKDKTDPLPDITLWNQIINNCRVQQMTLTTTNNNPTPGLTDQEKDKLFEANVQEINKINVAAGSMVKGLIMELERNNRNTYIRLHNAVENGHVVFYDLVQGDKTLVSRLANALGFKEVTESRLEVFSG